MIESVIMEELGRKSQFNKYMANTSVTLNWLVGGGGGARIFTFPHLQLFIFCHFRARRELLSGC